MQSIIDIRHPEYSLNANKWRRWRLTYKSGREFVNYYLKPFSVRETPDKFHRRRRLSYCPAFAKSAVNEIKNSIYQRTTDIVRIGGSASYQSAVNGLNGGVDLLGSTMSYFIGQKLLSEVLPLGKVGIYVDMPDIPEYSTKADVVSRHPYVYAYCVEDILSWKCDETDTYNEFSAVLLRDNDYTIDPETNLPNGKSERYRYLYLKDGSVFVKFFDRDGTQIDKYGIPTDQEFRLAISKIPFHIADIGESIIADAADYQIALLNLESSDLGYALLANYPFYTEQFEAKSESGYTKSDDDEDEIDIGPTQGRRYPVGVERPGFIHPSSEPLTASMAKEDNIKRDLRILVNLAVSNISPKNASAESKSFDLSGLEAGLSYIGLILQYTESKIAYFWSLYENSSPPSILYPTEYSLPDPESVRKDIDQYISLIQTINSPTYRKVLAKRIVHRSICNHVDSSTLTKINNEIDSSVIQACTPDQLIKDLDAGLVSQALASSTRGYPEDQVEQAKIDKAEELARIQAAQTSMVRGVNDTPGAINQDKIVNGEKAVRGPGQ